MADSIERMQLIIRSSENCQTFLCISTFPKISLVETEQIVSDGSQVANSFSNFFENAIPSLGIKINKYSHKSYGLKNPIEIAIKKIEQHPNINFINKIITNNESFHFSPTEHESIFKEILNLYNKKLDFLKTFLLIASRMYQMCSQILANIWSE